MLTCAKELMQSLREERGLSQQLNLLHNTHHCYCSLEEDEKKTIQTFVISTHNYQTLIIFAHTC
jgi:hypothetical protein